MSDQSVGRLVSSEGPPPGLWVGLFSVFTWPFLRASLGAVDGGGDYVAVLQGRIVSLGAVLAEGGYIFKGQWEESGFLYRISQFCMLSTKKKI